MRTIIHLQRAILVFTLFCLPAQGGAKIDFETLPNGTPTPRSADNTELHSPYTDGPTLVTFGFDTNSDFIIDVPAHFERRGDQDFLFAYQASPGDNDDADKTATHEGGTWLLRAPQQTEPSGPLSISQGAAFLVKYDGTLPVNISGQVWDIDSGEQIKIEVFDASRRLIASTLSFVGPGVSCCDGATDGLPFTFSFSNLSAPAAVVKITEETQDHPFSTFGFDNFSTTPSLHPSCALDCETSFAPTCSGPGWSGVGGLTPSAPHASVDAAGRVRLFVQGGDNGIWQNIDAGTGFKGWTPVGGRTPSAPAAVVDGAGHVRLFVQGGDNGIWQNIDAGTGFKGWTPVGGRTPSAPAAVVDGAGHVRLFVRGLDDGIWQNIDAGTGFKGWTPVGGRTPSAPAAVAVGDGAGHVRLFIRGLDNGVWQNIDPGNGFTGWAPLGGRTESSLAAVVDDNDDLHLYARGLDQRPYENVLPSPIGGCSWTGWQPLRAGGQTPSGPAAVSDVSGVVRLFVRGTDARVYEVDSQ